MADRIGSANIPDVIHPCPMCWDDIASGVDASGKPSLCDGCSGLVAQVERNHAQRVEALSAAAMSRAYVGPEARQTGRRTTALSPARCLLAMVAVLMVGVLAGAALMWALN
jgi:hypothetical protein